jgi:hypothetical protein
VNDDDATTLLLLLLLLSYAIPSLAHAHTNPRTHKRKQKFQRTLQNNFDFNTLCKTIATHFAKQIIPTHSACKNDCNALSETTATHFANQFQRTLPNTQVRKRRKMAGTQFDPPFEPLIRQQFFLSGGAGNLLLTFYTRLLFSFLFFSFLFFPLKKYGATFETVVII